MITPSVCMQKISGAKPAKPFRVCLVSPGHVASNPRLVKEADALHEAGYQVRVVAGDYMAAIRPLDRALLDRVSWQYTQVGLGSRLGYGLRRIRQELAGRLAKTGVRSLLMATWAHSPMSMRLAQVASAEPADLYIAHCLAALPAAAYAARLHRAKLGFDAEDYHIGELLDTPQNQTEIAIRDYLERTLLKRCDHLTAASPEIAAAYTSRYGVEMSTILNVFSHSDLFEPADCASQQLPPIASSNDDRPSLYWFSQTIGPGRGIEAVVLAMGKMKTAAQLCLRGLISDNYHHSLLQLAETAGLSDRITFLPSAPPDQMIALASGHDIGLSLELVKPQNRDICLTNKIFTYLLAGLPLLLSKTTAQIEIAESLGDAAILVDLENTNEVAAALDNLLAYPNRLAKAKKIAIELGRSRYNWEVEQQSFLASVKQALHQ